MSSGYVQTMHGLREMSKTTNEKHIVNPDRLSSKRAKGKVRIDCNNRLVITTAAPSRGNNDISGSTRQSAPISMNSKKYIDENECVNINNCNDDHNNHGHKKKSKKISKSKKEKNKAGNVNDNGMNMNMNNNMVNINKKDSDAHWSKVSKDNKYFSNVNNYYYNHNNNNSNYYNNPNNNNNNNNDRYDIDSYSAEFESYASNNNQMYSNISRMPGRAMCVPMGTAPMHMPVATAASSCVNYGYPSYMNMNMNMNMHCHDGNNFVKNEFENDGITINKDIDSNTRNKFEIQFKKHNIEQFINECLACGVYGKKFTALMYEKIQQQSSQ